MFGDIYISIYLRMPFVEFVSKIYFFLLQVVSNLKGFCFDPYSDNQTVYQKLKIKSENK